MSKLDEVLQPYVAKLTRVAHSAFRGEVIDEPNPNGVPLKQAIKDLMLELIGEDEQRPASGPQRNGTAQAVRRAHNRIRVELRQKVNDL